MATGIISTGLDLAGFGALSALFFGLAAALWLAIACVILVRLAVTRERLRDTPSASALTTVAATAVLGARSVALGSPAAGEAALCCATALWTILLPSVLRESESSERAAGSFFLVSVSTESLAVLAVTCGARQGAPWLATVALALFVLGLGGYAWVVIGFDFAELRRGQGDQWIAAGALAIAALACAQLAETRLALPDGTRSLHVVFADVSLGLWSAASLWLPLLVAGELAELRVHHWLRRWSTVFPLGMYAACSIEVGKAAAVDGLVLLGQVWIWVAVAAWSTTVLLTARGGVRAVPWVERSRPPASTAALLPPPREPGKLGRG